MKSLIISIFLFFVLVVTPKHVFAEPLLVYPHIEVADVFYAPLFNDTGVFGAFGGYLGGDSGSQIVDWSIGNTIPHSASMTDDIVFSTSVGHFMNSDNWFERMRITKEGNVGIGTPSPNAEEAAGGTNVLHLHNADINSASTIHLTNDTTGSASTDGTVIELWDDDHVYLWNYENKDVRFGTNNSTRMTIDNSGNVGIGTESPQTKLHVTNGQIRIDSSIHSAIDGGGFLLHRSDDSLNTQINIFQINNQDGTRKAHAHYGFGGDRLYITNNGTGNSTSGVYLEPGNTTWSSTSDERLKESIQDVTYGLDDVLALRPRDFVWKENGLADTGFIAQEVYDVFPQVVSATTNNEIGWGVNYAKLTPLIVAGIQELKAENDAEYTALKANNEAVKRDNIALRVEKDAEIAQLKERLETLETMMLALSTNPKETLVKLGKLNLDRVQKAIQ